MENRNVPFGIAVGAIVLVAGIAGLGMYRQSVPALNGNSASIVQLQGDQDVSDEGTVVFGSRLKRCLSRKRLFLLFAQISRQMARVDPVTISYRNILSVARSLRSKNIWNTRNER